MQIQVAARSFGAVETEKQIVQDAVQEYQRDKRASKPSTPATSRPVTSAPEPPPTNQVPWPASSLHLISPQDDGLTPAQRMKQRKIAEADKRKDELAKVSTALSLIFNPIMSTQVSTATTQSFEKGKLHAPSVDNPLSPSVPKKSTSSPLSKPATPVCRSLYRHVL